MIIDGVNDKYVGLQEKISAYIYYDGDNGIVFADSCEEVSTMEQGGGTLFFYFEENLPLNEDGEASFLMCCSDQNPHHIDGKCPFCQNYCLSSSIFPTPSKGKFTAL